MKYFFAIVILSVFASAAHAQPKIGSQAPEISLPNENGEVVKLSSLKGKVVLLDFWASWCGPCRQSNKHTRSVYNKFNAKGFEVFSVSIDGNQKEWTRAVQQDNMSWPQVIDTHAENGNQLTKTWNLQYIPATFLIDKEGRIVASGLEQDELEKLLKQML